MKVLSFLWEIAKSILNVKEVWYLLGILAVMSVYKFWVKFKQRL